MSQPDLSVDLAPSRPGSLKLAHPVLVAAGGAGYGLELLTASVALPGAIVTRGTTLRPQPGADPPRMVVTRAGLVSALGAPNPGIARVLDLYASRWSASDVPVILALCAADAAGFASLARAADARPGVAGLELHLGCRDVRSGRRSGGSGAAVQQDAVVSIVGTVRAATDLPLIAKLGAMHGDVAALAEAAVDGGADAISAIDGSPALVVDRQRRRPALGTADGRLSGPAVTPLAIRVVRDVARAVRVPIVGIGGVSSLDDVLDLLMAGASAVGLATAALGEPGLPGRLALELEAWCRVEGVTSPSEIVGAATAPGRRR